MRQYRVPCGVQHVLANISEVKHAHLQGGHHLKVVKTIRSRISFCRHIPPHTMHHGCCRPIPYHASWLHHGMGRQLPSSMGVAVLTGVQGLVPTEHCAHKGFCPLRIVPTKHCAHYVKELRASYRARNPKPTLAHHTVEQGVILIALNVLEGPTEFLSQGTL